MSPLTFCKKIRRLIPWRGLGVVNAERKTNEETIYQQDQLPGRREMCRSEPTGCRSGQAVRWNLDTVWRQLPADEEMLTEEIKHCNLCDSWGGVEGG